MGNGCITYEFKIETENYKLPYRVEKCIKEVESIVSEMYRLAMTEKILFNIVKKKFGMYAWDMLHNCLELLQIICRAKGENFIPHIIGISQHSEMFCLDHTFPPRNQLIYNPQTVIDCLTKHIYMGLSRFEVHLIPAMLRCTKFYLITISSVNNSPLDYMNLMRYIFGYVNFNYGYLGKRK